MEKKGLQSVKAYFNLQFKNNRNYSFACKHSVEYFHTALGCGCVTKCVSYAIVNFENAGVSAEGARQIPICNRSHNYVTCVSSQAPHPSHAIGSAEPENLEVPGLEALA